MIEQKEQFPIELGTEVPIEDSAATIRRMQCEWAMKNPQKAHEVYPDVYKADGSTIQRK